MRGGRERAGAARARGAGAVLLADGGERCGERLPYLGLEQRHVRRQLAVAHASQLQVLLEVAHQPPRRTGGGVGRVARVGERAVLQVDQVGNEAEARRLHGHLVEGLGGRDWGKPAHQHADRRRGRAQARDRGGEEGRVRLEARPHVAAVEVGDGQLGREGVTGAGDGLLQRGVRAHEEGRGRVVEQGLRVGGGEQRGRQVRDVQRGVAERRAERAQRLDGRQQHRRVGGDQQHLLVGEARGEQVAHVGHRVAHAAEERLERRREPERVVHHPAQVLLAPPQQREGGARGEA